MNGYETDEISGRNFAQFYTKADQDAGLPGHALLIAAATGKHEAEGWRVRKSGECFWANATLHPVRDSQGGLQGYVNITRDISQRLQMEQLRDDLAQSQKLEMVGQLTGGVAHDFNNLLTTIEAGHDLVLNYCADERVADIIDIARSAVNTSRKLISQLVSFSRRQVLHPKPTSVWDMISAMDVLIQRAVGEGISIRWSLQPALPNVMIDQSQFQATLLNLIVNARDAMPKGGVLTVSMEKMSLAEHSFVAPYDVPAGDYIVLGVSDTGAGMSANVQAHAIEPFFTTKDAGHGPGLGLSQCFGFARQSGGTLRIESIQGVGSTVKIMLPFMEPKAATARGKPTRTVLLVDDDTNIRALVGEMLKILGHKVIEARDAQDALECLNNDRSIDYLFSDIVMPNDMNGVQLMQAARAVRPACKRSSHPATPAKPCTTSAISPTTSPSSPNRIP